MREPLSADQHQGFPQQGRQRSQRPAEIAHLPRHLLCRFNHRRRSARGNLSHFALPASQLLVEGVADHGHAPGAQVDSGLQSRQRLQRPYHGLLDQIVRLSPRSGQESGEGPEFRQQFRERAAKAVLGGLFGHGPLHINEYRIVGRCPREKCPWKVGDDKAMTVMDRAPLIRALPYARRYARALTGDQQNGDAVVAIAVRKVLAAPAADDDPGLATDAAARVALYGAIGDEVRQGGAASGRAMDRDGMSQVQRMLLLLTALEEQPLAAAAAACRLNTDAAELELRLAREDLRSVAAARVLIIEDEPIIALDIQELVERCGHTVVGVAATEAEAVAIARAERPSLVLADINLGAGGDGANAVARILQHITAPVIFVTAYPERLLTGTAVEPAFIITKPFDPTTLAVATFQAVTRGVRPL